MAKKKRDRRKAGRRLGRTLPGGYLKRTLSLSEIDPGDIREKLIEFVHKDPQISRRLMKVVERKFGHRKWSLSKPVIVIDGEEDLIKATDDFIYAPMEDGRTPLEVFIEKSPYAEEVKDELMKWHSYEESIFKILEKSSNEILCYDVVSHYEYRVRATIKGGLSPMKKGMYMFGRIIPWKDHYIFSGATNLIGSMDEKGMEREIEKLRKKNPMLVGNVKEDVEKAYEAQANMRSCFIEFFGSDEVVFKDGWEMDKKIEDFYHHYCFERVIPETGKSLAESYRETYGREYKFPGFDLSKDMLRSAEAGVIFDEEEGLVVLSEYGLFRRTFEVEDFKGVPNYRDRVMGYISNDSIPPLVIERVVRRHPDNAQRVFQDLFGMGFKLDRDFRAMMRKFKGRLMVEKKKPMITIVGGGG
jgi:hypothetical protein